MRASRRISIWQIAIATALAAGCAQLRTPETQLQPLGARPQPHASAAITYRLQASAAPPAGGEVQLASYSPPPATGPRRTQILSIEYPHPAGRPGYALAELIVARDSVDDPVNSSSDWLAGLRRLARDRMPGLSYGEGIQSAWALDVPIVQVDLLIQRLDAQGYFADSPGHAAEADLSARINGQSYSKSWHAVPELNALVNRVRKQGKLVSHREPLALPPRSAPVAPVTTAAYIVAEDEPAMNHCERLPPVE